MSVMQRELRQTAPASMLTLPVGGQDEDASGFPRVRRLKAAETSDWTASLASLGLIGLLTAGGIWLAPVIKEANLAVLYGLAVASNSVLWGRRAAIMSAVSGALLFDFLFTPAAGGVSAASLRYLITLLALVAVAFVGSMPASAKTDVTPATVRRTDRTAALYSLTGALAAEHDPERILDAIIHHITGTFGRPIAILLPGAGALKTHFVSSGHVLEERDESAAAWVFAHGEEAGHGTAVFKECSWRFRPMKTWHGVVGVIGVAALEGNRPLPADQQDLLGAFINQAALAITRAELATKAQRAEVLQETDKLQKALLNSVSHDLRTPLVSVIGALNSVIHDAELLDASTQKALLATARDEAVRLNRVIQNLLDMSRLEGGAILARAEPSDVHDVVGAALEQLGEAARSHPISIRIDPALPLVPMDHALIVQTLVNLLDNALKYSPPGLPIEIEAGRGDDGVWVRIANDGPEISRQELERIFDKFYRGAFSGASRGVGLGLSICKGFVEAHRGRIRAEQRLQGGIAIVFSLPMRPEEQ